MTITIRQRSVGNVGGGLMLGTPRQNVTLPAPLPPVEISSAPIGSTDSHLGEVLQTLVRTYIRLCSNRVYARQLQAFAAPDQQWGAAMLNLARELKSGGMSPEGYVAFVVLKTRKRTKCYPHPYMVFGINAAKMWLPEYRRNCLDVLPIKHYTATDERRRAYAARNAYAAAK